MILNTINHCYAFLISLFVDLSLLTILFSMDSVEALGVVIKGVTSFLVLIFVMIRIFFFVRNEIRQNGKNQHK